MENALENDLRVDDLIDLVETYRKESTEEGRRKWSGHLCSRILGEIRIFIFGKVDFSVADDVLQETMKAIVTSLFSFRGKTDEEFYAWCYGIARHKVYDQRDKKAADRLQPFPTEELLQMVEAAYSQDGQLSPEQKLDLEYALNLLAKSKPECRDLLWDHYVVGQDYAEIAAVLQLNYDAIRMKVNRCLKTAQMLVSA